MAKSTSGTKKINEALTPDQVSKVEDKYKSIYSGMLKGNKKKLMKYIDPKLKRPNPDAMAMGRAINLVKKETETETVNEAADPKVLSAIETLKKVKAGPKRKEAMAIVLDAAYKKTGEKVRTYKQALQFLDLEEPINEQMDIYDDIANSEFGMDYDQLGPNEQEWVRDEIDNMELREEKDKATWQYTLLNKGDKTVTIKADDIESANSQILKTHPNSDPMLTHKNGKEINWNSKPMRRMRKTVNETLKLGVKYQLPTGETGYISTKGSTYPSQWEFTGTGEKYLDVEDKLTPLEKQPGKYDGAFDMGRGKGHHIDEELVNEENSYDSFKTDASERFLNRSQVVELLPVLKNSLNKLNFNPSKQPTLSVKRYGLSSSNKGYVISMYIPTSKDDIIVELGKYPKDDKTDEVSISLYLPNEEGRLTQVAYETSTSPKGEELAEDSNVLSKVISMANQWYEKPTTMVKEEAGMPPSPNANTGDLFSSLEATGKLEAPQGGASMVGQNYTLNGDSKYDKMFFSYEPNSPTPFGLKQIGGHGLDSRFLSKFGLKPTQSWTAGVDQFIFDGNYNPRWFDEKRFSEIVDHFSGGLSREAKRQRDFYKDRGQTSGTIDERLNEEKYYVTYNYGRGQGKGLVKQVDMKTFQPLDEPRTFDSYEEAENLVKTRMSGGASPGQMTAYWVSDENMNRIEKPQSLDERLATLVKEVYSEKQRKWACAQDGPEFDEMCKDTAISKKKLKETTMNNDRLTELIKAALTGPVKEESTPIKEGVWSRGTATQIRDFLRDLNSLKDKYYSIVGSDDVFDGLNRAERAAEEMAYDAGRSIKEITELATTPIKDDIYAIGSRIYKDPYEAISLVATDQTVVVRDFARKDKKFKAAVMDYVKSKGLETSVDRDGLYIDTKPLDFKGIPLMNEKKQRPDYPDIDGDGDTKEPMAKAAKDKKSMVESIFKKLRG